MSTKRTSNVDLVRLFSSVTSTLKENQQPLNEADQYNHNHGDNMVDSFKVITRAVRAKKASPPAEQLSYASELLSQRSQSGSAQLYSQGLAQAADRLKGKPAVTQTDAMLLVQSLLGGQTSAPQGERGGMEDLLGSLLGGQTGAQQSEATGGGDMLGGLLGSLMGAAPTEQPNQTSSDQGKGGIDLNTVLSAGMTFLQARQQGTEPMTALVNAVMAGSQMHASPHREQSGQMVAETLLNSLGSMFSGKKKR